MFSFLSSFKMWLSAPYPTIQIMFSITFFLDSYCSFVLACNKFLASTIPFISNHFSLIIGLVKSWPSQALPTSTSPQLSFSVHLLESPGSVSTLRRAAPRSAHGCRKGLPPLTALSKAPGCQLSVSPPWVVVKAGSHLLELTLPFCLLKDYHLLACGGDIVLWRA